MNSESYEMVDEWTFDGKYTIIINLGKSDEKILVRGKFGPESEVLIGQFEIENGYVNIRYSYKNMAASIHEEIKKACEEFGYGIIE